MCKEGIEPFRVIRGVVFPFFQQQLDVQVGRAEEEEYARGAWFVRGAFFRIYRLLCAYLVMLSISD